MGLGRALIGIVALMGGATVDAPAVAQVIRNYTFTTTAGTVGISSFSLLYNGNAPTLIRYQRTASNGYSFNTQNTGLGTSGANTVYIGGNPNGPGATAFGFDDFYFAFNPLLTVSNVSYFYTQVGQNGSASATATIAQQAVPEPSAWALIILGFGLTGAALRRRRYYVGYGKLARAV